MVPSPIDVLIVLVSRSKRDSDSDGEAEVYDNIYSAISEAGTSAAGRDKRQNVGGLTQQNREGKNIRFANDDQIAEPTIRETSAIGFRQPPDEEDGFLPSFPPVDRFPRGAGVSTNSPRIFEELVDLISPPFNGQQHNTNFRTTTNNNNNNFNNFPQTFATSTPTQFSSSTFSSFNNNNQQLNSQFSGNNNNQLNSQFSGNGNNFNRGNQLVQSTTPFPQTFQATAQTPSFPTSAAASQKLVLNSGNGNDQKFGKLRTGNGLPVKQDSVKPPKSKKNKKSKQNNNNNNNNNNDILFGVELVDSVGQKRQGKENKQPPLTFISPDLTASSSSNSLSKLSGRQVNKIDGFPNGLPAQVPEGVRIALESAQRGKLSCSGGYGVKQDPLWKKCYRGYPY